MRLARSMRLADTTRAGEALAAGVSLSREVGCYNVVEGTDLVSKQRSTRVDSQTGPAGVHPRLAELIAPPQTGEEGRAGQGLLTSGFALSRGR
jgi:hypothetical protein